MPRMVSVKVAAAETGLSVWELKRGANANEYPYIRIGEGRGKFLFDIDLLNEKLTHKARANGNMDEVIENVVPFGIRKVEAG